MSHDSWYTGIILAGGKSSRMGTDKASLRHQGRSLLEIQLDLAKPFCEEVYVSSNHSLHELSGTSRVPDRDRHKGPLMGLYSCLKHSQTNWNLVMSCDMPAITEDDIELLKQHQSSGYRIICFSDSDRLYPFPGWYHRSIIDDLKEHLESGNRRVTSFLEQHALFKVLPETHTQSHLINLNTPEAFGQWQKSLVK